MLSSETRNSQRILHHEPETRRLIVSLKVCVCVCVCFCFRAGKWLVSVPQGGPQHPALLPQFTVEPSGHNRGHASQKLGRRGLQ